MPVPLSVNRNSICKTHMGMGYYRRKREIDLERERVNKREKAYETGRQANRKAFAGTHPTQCIRTTAQSSRPD